MPTVLMLTAFTGGRSEVAGGGGCNRDVTVAHDETTADQLGPAQLANAATVVSVGLAMNVLPRGVLIALAAAHHPAADEPTLKGKRVVLSTPEGFVYDLRAISQIQGDADGKPVVDVATEEDYFRWMVTYEAPRSRAWPAHLVWVE